MIHLQIFWYFNLVVLQITSSPDEASSSFTCSIFSRLHEIFTKINRRKKAGRLRFDMKIQRVICINGVCHGWKRLEGGTASYFANGYTSYKDRRTSRLPRIRPRTTLSRRDEWAASRDHLAEQRARTRSRKSSGCSRKFTNKISSRFYVTI